MKKWSSVLNKFLLVVIVGAMSLMTVFSITASAETPSTTSTVAVNQGLVLGETYQRHNFESGGRDWVFWCNGTAILYSSSTDANTWESPQIFSSYICNEGIYCCNGSSFSLWYDVTTNYAHIAYMNVTGTQQSIWYARIAPQSNGVITSDTPQEAVPGVASLNFSVPSICLNSLGYPYIAYMATDINTADLSAYVSTSIVNSSGTWTNATNSTIDCAILLNDSVEISYPSVIPVTAGNVSIQYAYYNVDEDLFGQNYAQYNVSDDSWLYADKVDILDTPSNLSYSWKHSEVAYSSANNTDDVFVICSIYDDVAGDLLLATSYGNVTTPFNISYFNSLAYGDWTGTLSIRDTNGNLTATVINDSALNSIWSADYNMDTLQWGTLTDVNLVSSTSEGIMSAYRHNTSLGFLYYQNVIQYLNENLNYGCYGCTPAVVPATVPVVVSTMAQMIAIMVGAIIIFILIAYAFVEIKENGFTEAVGVTFMGVVGLIVIEIIIIAVL